MDTEKEAVTNPTYGFPEAQPPPPYSNDVSDQTKGISSEIAEPIPTTKTPTVVTRLTTLSTHPMNIVCPSCNTQVITMVVYKEGSLAYLAGCGLIFLFGIFSLCCIFDEAFKDANHYCPNCKVYLGTKKRL